MRKVFIPLFIALLALLTSESKAQKQFPDSFQLITIAKQVDTLIHVNFIGDASFDTHSFEYSIGDIQGSGQFSSSGKTAGASINTGQNYLQIKNKTLHISIDGFPKLIIPSVYVPGDIRIVANGQVLTNESALSRTAVWSCKTTVENNQALCNDITKIKAHLHGTGEVMLITLPENNYQTTVPYYSETFLPGEVTARKASSQYDSGGSKLKGVFIDLYNPGRASSLPAILNAAESKYLITGQMNPGFYRWYAPDLSDVFVWSADIQSFNDCYGNYYKDLKRIINSIIYYDTAYQNKTPVFPALMGADIKYNKEFITFWKSFRYYLNENGEFERLYLPKLAVVPVTDAFDKMEKHFDMPVSLMGERPLYFPQDLSNTFLNNITLCDKAASNILTSEKLYTILAMLKGGFGAYPQEIIDEFWNRILYPEMSDDDADRIEATIRTGDSLIAAALHELSLFVNTAENGRPIMVFNPSAHPVTNTVSVPLGLPVDKNEPSAGRHVPGNNQNWIVLNEHGDTLNAQLIKTNNNAHILFNANRIPGIGYKTFYLKAAAKHNLSHSNHTKENNSVLENDEIKVFAGKEILSLKDNLSLSQNCGVLICNSISGDTIYDSRDENIRWHNAYDGNVASSVYSLLPTPLGEMRFAITLFHQTGKIAYDLDIRKTNENAEDYVIKIPVFPSIKNANVKYKTPYGISAFGRAELTDEVFPQPFNKRMRNVLHWATIGDDKKSVLLSGDFVYCEMEEKSNRRFSVTPFLFPLNNASFSHHLELQLFSSNDNDMPNTGDAYTTPLLTVTAPEKNMSMLPGEVSFFALRNKNLSVSAIKKARNSDDVIIRIVEPCGKDGFALMEPMFSFSGFSSANLNESVLKDLNAAATIKPKLKAPVKAFSINTFILHP